MVGSGTEPPARKGAMRCQYRDNTGVWSAEFPNRVQGERFNVGQNPYKSWKHVKYFTDKIGEKSRFCAFCVLLITVFAADN